MTKSKSTTSSPAKSSTSATTTTTPTLTIPVLGNIEIVSAEDADTTQTSGVLYPMDARKDMQPDKLQELFHRASERRTGHKYELVSIALDDPDTLKRTYALGQTFAATKQHLTKYDMLNVFIIVRFTGDPNDLQSVTTHDLFVEYSVLSKEEVAASNKFYATRIKDKKQQEYLRQNLGVTAQYFENNCAPDLRNKVNKQYRKYKPEEQGGPIFYKIMVDLLLVSSRDAVSKLLGAVRLLDISQLPGEDVSDAVSLISGTYEYLKNLASIDSTEPIPKTFTRDVLRVLQTTTNSGFNLFFQTMEAQEARQKILAPGDVGTTVEDILQCATSEYTDRLSNSAWDGVKQKRNETKGSFTAGHEATGGRKCFNCDDPGHMLDKCPKTKDATKIAANRSAAMKGKKDNKTKKPKGKWAPPTDAEKRNKNKRTIDGKPMYYHYKTQRWMPDKFATEANLADGTPTTPAPGPASAPPAVPAANTGAPTNAAEFNAFQSFKTMMRAFNEAKDE